MADTCQARAGTEDLISSIDLPGRNIVIKEQRIKTRLPKKALREISISERPSFKEGLQFFREDVLTSSYIILGPRPPQKVYLDIRKVLLKWTFLYLRFDAIRSHLGKLVHERRVLSRVPTAILRAVTAIFAAVTRTYSFPGLQMDILHRRWSLLMNEVSYNGGVRGMLEGMGYRAAAWFF